MEKTNTISKIISSLFVILFIVFLVWVFKNIDSLSVSQVREYIESYGVLGPIVFMLFYVLVIVLIIPNTPFTLLAGIMFGLLHGFIYTLVATTVGAIIAFYIAKYIGLNWVRKLIKYRSKKIEIYNEKIRANGFLTVFLTRITPFMPFKMANYMFGLSKIRTKDYILGTFLGKMPEFFIFAYLGASLESFSVWRALGAIGGFLILFAIGWYWNNFYGDKKIID